MPIPYETVVIPDAATYTVKRYNSGMVHYIGNLTADITITLPTPDQGLWYEFVYAGVAADAQDWIISTGSNTNFYIGGLLYVDDAPAADSVAGNGSSNSKVSVLVPEPGTRVRVECTNGVNWCLSGAVAAASAPTFADQ